MWGDAGALHTLAKKNPLRWSGAATLKDTIDELRRHQVSNPNRPVKIRLENGSDRDGAEVPHEDNATLENVYPNVETAAIGLQEYIFTQANPTDLRNDEDAEMTRPISECTDQSIAWQSLCRHHEGQSRLTARWMWSNVGLSDVLPIHRKCAMLNPCRWTKWCSVAQAIHDLGASVAERPVILQIKSTSREGTSIRYIRITAHELAAVRILLDVLESSASRTVSAAYKEAVKVLKEAASDLDIWKGWLTSKKSSFEFRCRVLQHYSAENAF